jgi:uncharacterized protein (TIGR02271 family)
MSQTVIGVFDSYDSAQQAAQAVIASGVDRENVRISPQSSGSTTTTSTNTDDKGFWESLKDSLGFGDESDDRYGYREATRRGNTMVTVEARDAQADEVAQILQRYNAINMDDRAMEWRDEGWTGYDAYQSGMGIAQGGGGYSESQTADASLQAAVTRDSSQIQQRTPSSKQQGGEKLEVVEEQLQVGKRAMDRGGVRIHTRVTEQPVQEEVSLRKERVNVERTPVNRPVTSADEAFHERTIEARATSEQAVVEKQARVVEEVRLNKEVEQQTETVRDTVKRQDVDVEQVGGQSEERFRPAYAFADELTTDQRYRGRDWSTVESDARSSFEQRHPNSKWDEFKDAIRSRYERAKSSMRD